MYFTFSLSGQYLRFGPHKILPNFSFLRVLRCTKQALTGMQTVRIGVPFHRVVTMSAWSEENRGVRGAESRHTRSLSDMCGESKV